MLESETRTILEPVEHEIVTLFDLQHTITVGSARCNLVCGVCNHQESVNSGFRDLIAD